VPGLVALSIAAIFWPWLAVVLALWLLAPVAIYAWIAARGLPQRRGLARAQFVVVHSLKQYAQMLGIWAGVLNGTGQA
jgi:hypothetical protein